MSTFFEIRRDARGEFFAWSAGAGRSAGNRCATPDAARTAARALWGTSARETAPSLAAFPAGAVSGAPAPKPAAPKAPKALSVDDALALAEKVLAQVEELRGDAARVEKHAEAVVGAIEGLTYLSPQARSGELDRRMGLVEGGAGNVEHGATTLTLGAPKRGGR